MELSSGLEPRQRARGGGELVSKRLAKLIELKTQAWEAVSDAIALLKTKKSAKVSEQNKK